MMGLENKQENPQGSAEGESKEGAQAPGFFARKIQEQDRSARAMGAMAAAASAPSAASGAPKTKAEEKWDQAEENSEWEVLQIVSADRYAALMGDAAEKKQQQVRLACWVLVRNKKTGRTLITGAYPTPDETRLRLGCEGEGIKGFKSM